MSYVPPQLRNTVQQAREKSATPLDASSSRHGHNDAETPTSLRTTKPRSSHSLSASRHAQPSAKPLPSRVSRRHDSAFALESDPNDIKPRRNIQENGTTGSSSGGSGKGLLTDMELIGTVSRSGGLGDENDALKDFDVQEQYRAWIQTKLDTFEQRFPEYRSAEIDVIAKEALEITNNILIYFRKLREGLISSRRVDDFAIEVYETSAAYAIRARNHPQIISSLSILVPNGYNAAMRPQTSTIRQKSLHENLRQLGLEDRPTVKIKTYPRKELFASLLLLYDIIYRQSPRDFVNRFSTLTQAAITPQGRRRRRSTKEGSFLDANDPHMLYTWNVYQALSQSSPLWLNALRQPVVRLRAVMPTKKDEQLPYRTDPLQRVILSWATDRVRQDAWHVLQKGYHPQLGLGVDWCSRLLLFPSAKARGEKEEWGEDDPYLDMRNWIRAQGGRIENFKVFPSQG